MGQGRNARPRAGLRSGRKAASGHRRQEPALFLPLAAGQRNLPVRLPQAGTRAERHRDPQIRSARRREGTGDRQTPRPDGPHLRTEAGGQVMHANRTALSLGLLLAAVPAAFAQKVTPGQHRPRPRTGTQVVPGRRRLRGQPLRRRPAVGQADRHELRPGRPPLDRVQRGLPADQARRQAERQDHRPRRHQRRRRRRQDHRFRRRPADPHRRHAGRRRRLRRGQYGPASSLGHQRRRQGGQTRGHSVGIRHRGHAPHGPRPALGAGRAALLQPVGLHPQPHRDAARRPRR